MPYSVEQVCNHRTMNAFLTLPQEIYRGDPNWVPPISREVRRTLDERRNPYFVNADLKLFVCYLDGVPLARIAVVVNRLHWERFRERAAFFGFFEAVEDQEAVERLFEHVEHYCRLRAVSLIEGPFNPNHYSELGLQMSHHGLAPAFFQTYNPAYYSRMLERVGFQISKRLHTRRNGNIREYVLQRYGNITSPGLPEGYEVRTFRKGDFKAELERIREVFNDAFSDNWHFLPLTKEEYLYSAKFLNLVTRPELVVIVEHHKQPVGVLECVLDINPLLKGFRGNVGPLSYLELLRGRKSLRSLIIYAVGIKKAYQRTRVYSFLLDAMRCIALDYDSLETTWMSDENILALRAAEHLGLQRDREFAIYKKAV